MRGADPLARADAASRTSPRSSRSYRPGPMGTNMHNDYAARKNGRKPVEYYHPDARGDPRAHLRPDDLPRAAHARRAAARGLLARRGRQPAQGRGEEEARPDGRGALEVRRAAASATATDRVRRRDVRRDRTVRRLLVPEGAHVRATASSRTKPRGSRRTTRCSTSPRCSRASSPTSTKPRSTSTSAGCSRSPCSSPTSTRRRATSRCEFGDDARRRGAVRFGLSAVRNVGEGVSALIIAEREANGPFTDFHDFCDRVDPGCSTSARSSR